eukprot:11189826-Heterocapsa_arctica.AAC.1
MLGKARLTALCRPSALPQASLLGDRDLVLGPMASLSSKVALGAAVPIAIPAGGRIGKSSCVKFGAAGSFRAKSRRSAWPPVAGLSPKSGKTSWATNFLLGGLAWALTVGLQTLPSCAGGGGGTSRCCCGTVGTSPAMSSRMICPAAAGTSANPDLSALLPVAQSAMRTRISSGGSVGPSSTCKNLALAALC